MSIDYKKELEAAARSMILVHEPDTLIRMIVRLMVQKVKVVHAGILLHDEAQKSYILRVSRGPTGLKIPSGFARMDYDNALIKFFRERKDKEIVGDGVITYQDTERLLKKRLSPQIKEILRNVSYQMEILEAVVCIPSYFQDELLGILFLSRKRSGQVFQRKELDFFVALASDVAMAIRNARLFKQIQDELNKRQQLFINTIVALATAIEAKDRYTHGHTERVTNLSLEIARKLMKDNSLNIDGNFLENLRITALLHDIGKIGVPEYILNKRGTLTVGERNKIKEHPLIGVAILKPIKEMEDVIIGVKYHHERYDGKGYPEGLNDGKIPLIAAIVAVADSFDAMTTDRPYRPALPKEKAFKEIKRQSGRQFDPQVVKAFSELFEENKDTVTWFNKKDLTSNRIYAKK